MRSLAFEPLIPLGLWVALTIAAVALLAWYARDRMRRTSVRSTAAIATLMALAIALPLAILLNPTWHERVPPPEGKPLLTVLVDTSASMATPDGSDGQSRLQQAVDVAQGVARELSERNDVQIVSFAASTSPVAADNLGKLEASGAVTDLAGGIGSVLTADRPLGQAVLLLSDGIHNAGGGEEAVLGAAMRAKVLSTAVFPMPLGGDWQVRDLAAEVHSPQDLAFVGQKVPVRAEIVSHGFNGAVATVTLWLGDKEVERREVTLAGDKPQEVEFQVSHADSGLFRYEIRAEPLDREVTDVNNRSSYVLRVVDEPIRILLLEGKPYWDTKFLMRTLASDSAVELTSVVRMSEGRFLKRTLAREGAEPAPSDAATAATSPATAEPPAAAQKSGTNEKPVVAAAPAAAAEPAARRGRGEAWAMLDSPASVLAGAASLTNYQVVILGRDAEVYLSDDTMAQLKHWIAQDGGALVCFRGTPTVQVSQRLGAMLPVRSSVARESRFHLQLTEIGKQLRWVPGSDEDVLAPLPTLATRSESTAMQPLAVVWAVGQTAGGEPRPAVTSMPYGAGRVVVLEGAGMWRWAFMAPKFEQHEQIYAALWQSLTRWLVSNTGLLPTQTLSLRSDRVRFSSEDTATASLLVRVSAVGATPLVVELSGEGLPTPKPIASIPSGDEPGVYRVVFGKLAPGRYQAAVAGAAAEESAASTMFEVRKNVDEVLHLASNVSLLTRVAEKSGGEVLESASPRELAANLQSHLERARPEQIRTVAAWDRWWVLSGVLALWALTWGVRRAAGLV